MSKQEIAHSICLPAVQKSDALPASYEVMDEVLELISFAGPELANGLTNHAPMTIEALCAIGRGDAVLSWIDGYRTGLEAWPAGR